MRFDRPIQNEEFTWARSDIGNIGNISLELNLFQARSYNELHQLESVASVSQVFNADMQMTTTHTGLTPLTWDQSGQLKQVVVPGGLSVGIEGTHGYGYDASGRRVWKNKDATIEADEHLVFIYSGPNCIAEYLAGDDPSTQAPQREFVYGTSIDELLLIDTGTQQLGVTRNQQWSITALYDNSDGSVVERYTYDMFGNRRTLNSDGTEPQTPIFSTIGNPYGYTSRRHDEESSLMYFRARYYDPTTGEFVSKDPMEYVDGMSLYRGYFVPNAMDPEGKRKVCCKIGYAFGNSSETWIRETECPTGHPASICCSKLQGAFGWKVSDAVDSPCRHRPNPRKTYAGKTACCAGAIAFPTDLSDVVGTPVGCFVAAGAGITFLCCASEIIDYPFDNPNGGIVEKAKEIQAAIDRLFEMLGEAKTAARRNEIMAAIERLRKQLEALFK